jgi:predicted RNA-binding Zn-ribbon protein involved in translation (DUF1610 family)
VNTHQQPKKSEGDKKAKHHAIKFCPKCGSTQVFWAQGMPQFWSIWQCSTCGYRGAVILEDGNMARVLQEKWKKQNSPAQPNEGT